LPPRIRRKRALAVVDDVAAALDGAHVLLAVAAQLDAGAGAFHHVGRCVLLSRREAVTAELLRAARRQGDRGLADLLSLRVLVERNGVEAAEREQKQGDFGEPSGQLRHGLVLLAECAFAQLQVMRDRAGEEPNVAHRGFIDGRYETVDRAGVAPAHAVLKRHPRPQLGVEAVGIDEAVRELFDGVARSTGVLAIGGALAREARCVLMGMEKEVVAVLDGAYELAIFAEIADTVTGAERFPAGLRGDVGVKHGNSGGEVRPKQKRDDDGQRGEPANACDRCVPGGSLVRSCGVHRRLLPQSEPPVTARTILRCGSYSLSCAFPMPVRRAVFRIFLPASVPSRFTRAA